MTNEHTSLEKYTSHTLFEMVAKGLSMRGELETEQTATYWPPVPLSFAALLSRSVGLLNLGSWESIILCWVLVLSTASYLQLTDSNWICCDPGLYNCLATTCFLLASHLHPIQHVHSQGYTLISSTGCTCSLIDSWVGGQYGTDQQWLICHKTKQNETNALINFVSILTSKPFVANKLNNQLQYQCFKSRISFNHFKHYLSPICLTLR